MDKTTNSSDTQPEYILLEDEEEEVNVSFREGSADEDDTNNNNTSTYFFEDDPPPAGPDSRRPRLVSRSEPAELNGLNYLNVVTYILHLFVSYGIGVSGLGGLIPTRWQISQDFYTLITPDKWAYYLWAPILVSEAIFALAQLLPLYRARPIVQDGIGYFFFYTCLVQTAWTIFFSFELFVFSFISVLGTLICLALLLASQHASLIYGRKSLSEYWLFRFPFYLHCGWMVLMMVVHFSILFRRWTSDEGVQLAADIVSLGLLLPVAAFFMAGQPSGPDFVIPLVILWSYIGIGSRLLRLHTYEDFSREDIVAIRDASFFFAGVVVFMIVPRGLVWISHEFLTIHVLELDDCESGPSGIRCVFD